MGLYYDSACVLPEASKVNVGALLLVVCTLVSKLSLRIYICVVLGFSMAYSLPGWERFFEELASFVRACDRQSGTANQSFAEYALERIQTST